MGQLEPVQYFSIRGIHSTVYLQVQRMHVGKWKAVSISFEMSWSEESPMS